jgi:hypothetical protein
MSIRALQVVREEAPCLRRGVLDHTAAGAEDDAAGIVHVGFFDRGDRVRGFGGSLDTVLAQLKVGLEQIEDESVALVEVAALAEKDEHPDSLGGRPEPDVDPAAEGSASVELVEDLSSAEIPQRHEVRQLAGRRPIVRPLAITARGMLVA